MSGHCHGYYAAGGKCDTWILKLNDEGRVSLERVVKSEHGAVLLDIGGIPLVKFDEGYIDLADGRKYELDTEYFRN